MKKNKRITLTCSDIKEAIAEYLMNRQETPIKISGQNAIYFNYKREYNGPDDSTGAMV